MLLKESEMDLSYIAKGNALKNFDEKIVDLRILEDQYDSIKSKINNCDANV